MRDASVATVYIDRCSVDLDDGTSLGYRFVHSNLCCVCVSWHILRRTDSLTSHLVTSFLRSFGEVEHWWCRYVPMRIYAVTIDILMPSTGQVASDWWSWELVGRALHISLPRQMTDSKSS